MLAFDQVAVADQMPEGVDRSAGAFGSFFHYDPHNGSIA